MARKNFPRKERLRLFELHGGKCHICDQKIQVGEVWELEHLIAWELTKDDSDDNVRPAHQSCHKAKTREDTRAIRKADRCKAKHLGVKVPKRNGFLTNRNGLFKKKVNGEVERR